MLLHKAGLLNEKPSLLLHDYNTLCGASQECIEIPEKFMLPQDRIPTCRNQKTTGQCTAFATAGILEILNYLETGERTLFSTTYIYGRHRKEGLRSTWGMYVSELMRYLVFLGSVPNDMMPQLYENPEAYDLVRNSDLNALDAVATKTHISSYIKLTDLHGQIDKTVLNIKKALLKYQIPIFGDIKMDGAGHAICIIGWDEKYIYYMNSWGENYGDKGVCKFKPDKLRDAYLLLDAKNTPIFPFVDVPSNHWAYHSILRCYSAGIINGIDGTHFSPDTILTKAHVAQALYKFAQKWSLFNGKEFKEPNNVISFRDVTPDKWYYNAVNYCVSKGLFNTSTTCFNPDSSLRRGDFCKVIYTFLVTHATQNRFKRLLASEVANTPFTDVLCSDINYSAITYCYGLSLINGVSETRFMPESSLTRAHLCQIVYKAIKLLEEYETN